jgi:hypothetical protein
MAISATQYIDLLFKKLYGVAKTATAAQKGATNEAIPSPPLLRGDIIWMQSDQIPGVAQTVSGLTLGYTGTGSLKMSVDSTVPTISGVRPTWLAQSPPGTYVAANQLGDWITPEFGSTWQARFFVDTTTAINPTTTGTEIFTAGRGGVGEFYLDNQAGVLNFIGESIPAVLVSNPTYVIYIVGYRYVGLTGVTNLPNDTNIGNLNFTSTTISSTDLNGNIIITPNGTGTLEISSNVTSNANITASFFIGNGSQLTGVSAGNAVTAGTVTASAQPNITSVGNLTSLVVTGNITAGNVSGGNLVTANYFSGDGSLLSNIVAISANTANTAITVTGNAQPNITSVGNLTSLAVTGNLIANSYQMGSGVYKFYTQSVYFSTTTSITPNQVIWSVPVADVSAIDFTIIATSVTGNTRQQCKMSATVLGSTVVYNEYAGLYINGGVGSFSVGYAGGGTPTVQLLVTPDSVNLTEYSILISEYTP